MDGQVKIVMCVRQTGQGSIGPNATSARVDGREKIVMCAFPVGQEKIAISQLQLKSMLATDIRAW